MNKDTREILSNGSILYLREYTPRFFEKGSHLKKLKNAREDSFIIIDLKGRGSSAVCYEAVKRSADGSEKRGVLKEFFPVDSDVPGFEMRLTRSDSLSDVNKNQIYSRYGTFRNFEILKGIYENSYAVLESLRAEDNCYAQNLNKYIPQFSFYRGIPSQPESDLFDKEIAPHNYTFYVWVENEPGIEEFDEYLKSVCEKMNKEKDGEKRLSGKTNELANILNCVLELTKCVDVLHRFGLYHLDLKPANFGVGLYNSRLDEDNIAIRLYDTNSLLSDRVRNPVVLSTGTKYFRSPEVINNRVKECGIQSDIYSIGTILFYALVIRNVKGEYRNIHFCEDAKECSREEYDRIAVNLKNSALLQSSDDTRQTLIFEKLLSVIRKALNRFYDSEETYHTADEMAGDLRDIIDQTGLDLGIEKMEENSKYQVKVVLEDKEEVYDRELGAAGAIQKLLFTNPLYDYFGEEQNGSNNVLVIGCGTYASEFIDYALELSQAKGCRLNLTVLTKESALKKSTYLATRKALPDFFEIDGERARLSPDDPYGCLRFADVEFKGKNKKSCAQALSNVLKEKYSYVFIALNNDSLNYSVASASKKFVSGKTLIAFVQYQPSEEKFTAPLKPVMVSETLEDLPEYPLLRQMALNVHLSWQRDYINNLSEAESEFKKDYYSGSSLEHALGIMYKLHSLGISLDFSHPGKAAAEFCAIKDKKTLNSLMYYEHCRWVTAKITDSWQTLTDLTALKTATKDEEKKLHPCIVPGSEKPALDGPGWSGDNLTLWDSPDADLSGLDALDALSVRCHRRWKTILEQMKTRSEENAVEKLLNELQEKLSGSRQLSMMCDSLRQTVSLLLYQDENSTEIVVKYKNLFARLQRGAKEAGLEDVDALLTDLDGEMTPVLEYRAFTDWKKKDEAIIRALPFILTYSTSLHLCIPYYFKAENEWETSGIFSNAASVLTVNPKYVTYIADGDEAAKNENRFIKSLQYVSGIIERHGLQTVINIKLLRNEKFRVSQEFRKVIKEVAGVESVEVLPYSGRLRVQALRHLLMQKSSREYSAVEINDTPVGKALRNAISGLEYCDEASVIPTYRFSISGQKFRATNGCDFLRYIENAPVLFIEDLCSPAAKITGESKPELMNAFVSVRNLYSGKHEKLTRHNKGECGRAWNILCKTIAEYLDSTRVLARFRPAEGGEKSVYKAIVPEFCKPVLTRFLGAVGDSYGAAFGGYKWNRLSSKTASLEVLSCTGELSQTLNALLSDPIKLARPDMIDITRAPGGFDIIYNSLSVSGIVLPQKHGSICLEMLEILCEEGYIRSLGKEQTPSGETRVSFTFASVQTVRLLSKEGYIFVLNAYYEAVKSGLFDDASTGVEVADFRREKTDEIDVVLTQGFGTLIIDCVEKLEIKRETYENLKRIAGTFGVNTVPVLLVDLGSGSLTAKNRDEMEKGEQLGIATLCADDAPEFMQELFSGIKSN